MLKLEFCDINKIIISFLIRGCNHQRNLIMKMKVEIISLQCKNRIYVLLIDFLFSSAICSNLSISLSAFITFAIQNIEQDLQL